MVAQKNEQSFEIFLKKLSKLRDVILRKNLKFVINIQKSDQFCSN